MSWCRVTITVAAASRRSAERQHKDGRHSCRARRPGTGAAVPDPQGLQHRRRRRPNRLIAPMTGAAHDCPSCHRSPRLAQCPQPSMGSAHPAPGGGRADRAHCHRTHWTNCPAVAMTPNATVSGSVSTRYSGESRVLLRHVQDAACIEQEHDGPQGPHGLLRRRGGRRGRGRGVRARRGPGGPESESRTGPVGPRRIMSHECRGSPAASGTWNLCRRRPERSTAAGSGSGDGQVRAKASFLLTGQERCHAWARSTARARKILTSELVSSVRMARWVLSHGARRTGTNTAPGQA